jgi:hypothetical protein
VAVVHHDGMKAAVLEGNRPGWWWGVMRSTCREAACARDGGSGGRPGEEDDRAGPARQQGWRGEGRVGRCRGEGRWAAAGSKTGNGPMFKKKFFSNFN